jgi:hypothetical protein
MRKEKYETVGQRPDVARTLWIDAICIDQENIPERNAQVLQMRSIYQNAKRVLIWVGEEDDDSHLTFAYIEYLAKLYERCRDVKQVITHGTVQQRSSPFPVRSSINAFARFLARPWFSRKWVIQEAAMAALPVLYYKDSSVRWLDFVLALLAFQP